MIVSDILAHKGAALFHIGPQKTMAEAVALMVKCNIGSVLVMDGEKLAGLITLREVLRGIDRLGDRFLAASVSDVMNPQPLSVSPEDSVDDLRSLMTENHISHAPVMDHGKLIGILSFHDVAKKALKDASFENTLLKQYIKNWPAAQ
ncbi:MAG: CBS domain-containing protein [Burkholderiales bacterium]